MLAVDDRAANSAMTRPSEIEHEDSLEQFEQLLLRRYLDKAPALLKPILGRMLGGGAR